VKIVVVGTSCSGKSTFARAISSRLGVECIELDALFWEPGWVEASVEVFRERTERALETHAWVAEGNYRKVRDLLWKRAETLIWLDYPFHIVFTRALFRTIKRVVTREILWNSNRESFRKSFLSRQSILLWVLQTYPQRKREYPELLSRPEYAHLKVLRFQSPRDAEGYLRGL
jgi:adenylate kinase family enzyme